MVSSVTGTPTLTPPSCSLSAVLPMYGCTLSGAPSPAGAAAVASSAPHSLQYASPGTVAAPQLGQTPPAGIGPEAFPASDMPSGAAVPMPPIGLLMVLTGLKPASAGAAAGVAGVAGVGAASPSRAGRLG